MTTQSIKADKLKLTSTLGGRQGLLIRRFYHILAGALAPLLLYGYAQDLAEYFDRQRTDFTLRYGWLKHFLNRFACIMDAYFSDFGGLKGPNFRVNFGGAQASLQSCLLHLGEITELLL